MSNPTEVQEEEMFGRITNRIDALIKGNANFEQLKEHIHTALDLTTETNPDMLVILVSGAHKDAKLYEAARSVLRNQEAAITALQEALGETTTMHATELKRADDLQAEKDLIAEKLGLIEEEPEPLVEPPETADDAPVAHASDGMDHDDDAAANADPAPDDEGAGE